MRGACRRCLALVALVTYIHTSGSEPVHSSTCEAGPSLGPVGAEIGRSLLQQQHGRDRRALLDIQAPAADGQPSARKIEDGRVIVEEEDETEPAAKIPVGTGTISTRSKSGSSSSSSKISSSNQNSSVPVLTAQQHQPTKEGLLSMVNVGLNVSRHHMGIVFNGLVANMSRWRQQVPSLASRTWTLVYGKGTRSGTDAMIAILAIFVLVALVCGWFVAYCRGEPARSGRSDRRFRTGNRHLTLPQEQPGNRGSRARSHSSSPGVKHDAGLSSIPVTWSRSMRTQVQWQCKQ